MKHNFNLTNIEQEFCLLYGEVGEAYEAWLKKLGKKELGEELVYKKVNDILVKAE